MLRNEILKNDDGAYGDPSDPFGPYFSQSSSSSKFSSDNLSIFGNIDYFLDESLKLSLEQGGKIMNHNMLIHLVSLSILRIICWEERYLSIKF